MMIAIVEIYSKGCPSCHYSELLQKKLGIYDKIKHILQGSDEHIKIGYETKEVPTFLIYLNNSLIEIYEKDVSRPQIEEIKKKYIH